MTLAGCSEATTQSLSTQGGMSGPADPLKCSPPSIDLGELPQGGSGRGGFSLANRVDRTIEVARIETSCECLSVGPARSDVGPGESVWVEILMDLAKEPDFSGYLSIHVEGYDESGTCVFRTEVRCAVGNRTTELAPSGRS
jgi:hypothetical protein